MERKLTMMPDQELTQHIRNIFRAGSNPDLAPASDESYEIFANAYEKWETEFGVNSEMPQDIYRISRVLGFIDGSIKDINVNEEPWVVVSMLEMNLLNRKGGIDLMPTLQVPKMIKNWEGEPGSEPDWLLEANRLLSEHHYRQFAADMGLDEEEIEEMMEGTPQDRAASFSFFG